MWLRPLIVKCICRETDEITKNLTTLCNVNCNCQEEYFIPVCGADNIEYFTACHAGCSGSMDVNDTTVRMLCNISPA